MKKNKIFSFLFALALLLIASTSLAQDPNTTEVVADEDIIENIILKAEAGENKNVAIGRSITFDASGSTIPPDKEATYHWDFGDGTGYDGLDATHIYERAGKYVVNLTISQDENQNQDFLIVSVEEEIVLLVADHSIPKKQITDLELYAQQHQVLLVDIKNKKQQENNYLTAQKLAQQILTSPDDIKQANIIILWTENNIGLNALSELAQIIKGTSEDGSPSLEDAGWKQKVIISVSANRAGTARIAQSTYNVLNPKYIVLTDEAALKTIIDNPNPDKIISSLNSNNHAYQLISTHSQRSLDNITPINFMSYLLNYLVNKGVSQNTIFLILILPVVATIISFARQVIGVKAFGIYVPSIIALTFLETDLKWGLTIFITLLIVGTLARMLAKKLRLLYMPRMAIVLTLVSLSIFAMYVIGSAMNKTGLLTISIFPIIVMIILTEKFIEVQIEKGNRAAIRLTIETLILSVLSFYIVSWESFKTLILAYPEIVLLTIILNLLLGRFTGLRVVEYFRFRKLLKNVGSTKE